MSKKVRSLIISLAVVAVLGGILAGVTVYMNRTAPEEEDPLAGVTQLINVVSGSSEDLEHITVKNPTDEYDVIYKLNDYDSKVWYVEPLLEAQPMSGSGSSVASACANINATDKFENVEDMGEYGLADPAGEVIIDYSDGSQMTVYLGSPVPADGGYYISTDREPNTVYVLSATSSDVFFQPLTDFLDLQITSYEDQVLANITGFTMSGTLLEEPIQIIKPDELTEVAKLGFNIYDIISPIQVEMKADVTSNLTLALMSIAANSALVVNPTEEELETYGMDDPDYVLEVTHPDWEDPLVLKTSKVNGVMYLMRNEEPVIFQVPNEAIVWYGWQVEDVMSSMVIMPRLGDLSQVEVAFEDTVYQFDIHTVLSEEKATEGQMIPESVSLGGEEINLANFQTFYQLMLNCRVDARSDGGEPEGEPVLTFVYTYADGGEDRVEFYRTENRRLYLSLNGAPDFFVRDTYYDKVVSEMDNLLNDIQVSIDWT